MSEKLRCAREETEGALGSEETFRKARLLTCGDAARHTVRKVAPFWGELATRLKGIRQCTTNKDDWNDCDG
jgi:hypothetical protein